jgi:copper chaperone NosL
MLIAFSSFPTPVLAQEDDISKHPSCKHCGMDRKMFSHSRMLVTYDDGTQTGTCSIHCLAVDLGLSADKTPKRFQVGDYSTKKLIDAEKAVWVIGGDKPGVMTKRAKWAFEKKSDADEFVKAHGGKTGVFDDAMEAAYEDLYSECPVCGASVSQYRDFIATIALKDASHVFFHGVKEMMKYYLDVKKYNPAKTQADIQSIYVTDHNSLAPVDGLKAFYVSGSDLQGPKGKDLIPFEKKSEAEDFMQEHKGSAILTFGEINKSLIESLD